MNDGGIQYWQQSGQYEQEQQTAPGGSRYCHIAYRQGDIMHIGKFSQSKYLKGSDFDQPKLLTIDHISAENVARDNEAKRERAIIYFVEMKKGMVANKTNLVRCAKIFGSEDTDDWSGKRVVVYFDEDVEMSGEIVGGLRVRAPEQVAKRNPVQSRQEAMRAVTDLDDDVNF